MKFYFKSLIPKKNMYDIFKNKVVIFMYVYFYVEQYPIIIKNMFLFKYIITLTRFIQID